ncbi:MAG: hypothetical protein IJT15_02055 [Rickettsiales bacterium]|nr:hypothetical protein [Rickettsiales bacterium]
MNSEDEEKKQQEGQELDLFKKFYDFACQCKQQEQEEEVEFEYCEDNNNNNKLQFSYDKNNANLIPNNINNIDLTSQPIFCCIGGFFVMFSQGKDGNTNVYALNDDCINKIDNNPVDINANAQDIKPYVFKIKDVPVDKAKKFLSDFVDNTKPEDVNDYAKQVKNELDFKCVFSKIVNNNNKDDIGTIVNENHQQLDVIKNIRDGYNEIHNNEGNEISFEGFDNEDVKLNYDFKTDSVSNEQTVANLTESAYYFGKYGLLMAITKNNNNGKVNVFATNAKMLCNNPYGNDEYQGVFAVYDALQEDAERFIKKLNESYMDAVNYTNIDSQEKFERFFQDHCKNNEIKIEGKEADTGCCLFNLCGCNKTNKKKEITI